jgi:hypothetical protein
LSKAANAQALWLLLLRQNLLVEAVLKHLLPRFVSQTTTPQCRRKAIEDVILTLGVTEYSECADFVVSLLEDVELELDQVLRPVVPTPQEKVSRSTGFEMTEEVCCWSREKPGKN